MDWLTLTDYQQRLLKYVNVSGHIAMICNNGRKVSRKDWNEAVCELVSLGLISEKHKITEKGSLACTAMHQYYLLQKKSKRVFNETDYEK